MQGPAKPGVPEKKTARFPGLVRETGMAVVQLVLAVVASASATKADVHSRGVNLYVGDLSAVFGYVAKTDDPVEAERARVRGHLLFAHDLLAAVDTASWPADRRIARARNLERLRVYALAGEFPHNDDHADRYRPTFVDNAGTLCAVGALLAADRGRGAAERIAAADKYGFVAQLHDPELAAWQETSGLSVAELGLIQPTYHDPHESSKRVLLPFGLLDRMQFAPLRVSATSELSSASHAEAMSLTLHAQMSTECDCHIGAYGTLPMSIDLRDQPGNVIAAGGLPGSESRVTLGTADVGIFGGLERNSGKQHLFRLGVLLPTASREQARLLPSARVGDQVLELPRTMGVRLSAANIGRWLSFPDSSIWEDLDAATRFEVGLDIAVEYSNALHDRITHVIPRAGLGTIIGGKRATVSFDTAVSVDPLVDFEPKLRWSAGITGRLARRDGKGWFIQPALTLATIRTPEGWVGTLALDLAAATAPKPRW
jgi:hypothetical protein